MDELRDFFEFTDILNTQMYLSTYYRLLAPLGFRGLEIAKSRYKGFMSNLTDSTQHLFENAVDPEFVKDMTLEEISHRVAHPYVNHTLDGVVFSPYVHGSRGNPETAQSENEAIYASDGKTHMMLDRIINNIRHFKIVDRETDNRNNSVIMRFVHLIKQMARALTVGLSEDVFKEAHPHILEFTKQANLLDKGVAHILNVLRSLISLSEVLVGHVLETLSYFLPLYWNLATSIMFCPIKIPFVYEWYTQKFTRGLSDFTITDLLTLLGGTVATWTYKLYNGNYAPYTSIDVDVLRTNHDPELILYTWGHDPRTSDVNDNITHVHRLGMHDWIPRTHWCTVTSLTTILYDVPMSMTDKPDVRNPGSQTYPSQIFNTIVGVMGRVGYYPFSQVCILPS